MKRPGNHFIKKDEGMLLRVVKEEMGHEHPIGYIGVLKFVDLTDGTGSLYSINEIKNGVYSPWILPSEVEEVKGNRLKAWKRNNKGV